MNKKLEEFNLRLKSSKIAVIGVGVSNLPLIDYLYNLGCNVTIFSDNRIEQDLSKYNYQVYEGTNALDNLIGFDIIFRSPGCLPSRVEIQEEIKRGAYVTTEVAEVIKLSPCKTIGVTGSDGKSTTTTLIELVLRENGYHTFLGGNIGIPLFTKIGEMKEDYIVVLELSSFQLMDMDVSPNISVITNISPNHLDKHKDYQEYIDSKYNIFKHNDGILVINKDNEITSKIKSNREVRYFSRTSKTNAFYLEDNYICFNDKRLISCDKFILRGVHNYENICTCLSAIYDMVDIDKSLNILTKFKGIEHRLELVREINGIKWYNDSVSSSPTRTIAGINSFNEDIVLIAGGYDKNLDYTPLAEALVGKVSKLILFGDTKDKIYDAVQNIDELKDMKVYIEKDLEHVVKKAYLIADLGEIVLFSPASASFDMFKNFADRGCQFKDLVNRL